MNTPPAAIDTDPPPATIGNPFAEPAPDELCVTFIGHASFLLRLPRPGRPPLTILTDPIFSERASPLSWAGPKRLRPPGWALEALPPINLLLISHAHYDHLDLPSLRALAAHSAPAVATPLGNRDLLHRAGLRRIAELDWWQEAEFENALITCLPARHTTRRHFFDSNRRLWGGLAVTMPDGGPRVIFTGDSGDGPHWAQIRARLGRSDLTLMPIGAYAPREFLQGVHIDPQEAVRACITLETEKAIGMHFGTFPLSDEPVDEPPRLLAEECRKAGLAENRFTAMLFGETRRVSFSRASIMR